MNKVIFFVGLIASLALYKICDPKDITRVLFASVCVVGNVFGLLSELKIDIVKTLKK